MSATAESVPRRYTFHDLANFPDDNLRREIIGGELFVTPAPGTRHQESTLALGVVLYHYSESHGGKALVAPCDVHFDKDNTVEPDAFFVRHDHLERVNEIYVQGPPDLVVEVSSPSTRRVDLRQKLELYERFGVTDYWFVDLVARQVLVYELGAGTYGAPGVKNPGDTLEAKSLPGLTVPVSTILRS